MQFIKPDINIDFIGKKKIAFCASGILIIISLLSLILHGGPKYGIDFAGGTVIQVKFQSETAIDQIIKGFSTVGIQNPSVQSFGKAGDHEYLIRTDMSGITGENFSSNLEKALTGAASSPVEIRRVEMVGPQVGKDLREKALFAMFYALLFITIYISGRFEMKWLHSGIVAVSLIGVVFLIQRGCAAMSFAVSIPFLIFTALIVSLALFWLMELKYAMGAIVALIHDVTITVGAFSLFGKEFSLPIIAALLTIIGYSLNDTIIVFDRIRENLKKNTREPLHLLINRSINETLSRTILTSFTTLIVVIALFLLGGGIIHDFAFAMLVGIVVGTYSSIYVASPILLAWDAFGRKRT
jgi:preprotein translocase subunit SecF